MVAIYGEMVEAYLCLSGVETWGSIDWGMSGEVSDGLVNVWSLD